MEDFWTAGSFWSIVTPAVAFLSLGLNVFQIIFVRIKNARNIKCNLSEPFFRRHDYKTLFIPYKIDNLSAKPIAITNTEIIIDKKRYCPVDIKLFVTGEIYEIEAGKSSEEYCYSDVLPINLAAYSSCSGFLAFNVSQEILKKCETPLLIEISTSHGKPLKMLLLPHHSSLDDPQDQKTHA